MSIHSIVFVSYSRADTIIVSPIVRLLRAALAGVPSASGNYWELVFQDWDNLPPGCSWETEIDRAIKEAARFFVFWCKHAAQSQQVRREYELAIALNKTVVPVLLDDTPLSAALSKINGIDLRRSGIHKRRAKHFAPITDASELTLGVVSAFSETLGVDAHKVMSNINELNPFFAKIARFRLRDFEYAFEDMSRGLSLITGTRERIVAALTKYLSILDVGDEYLEISTAAFWSSSSMGVDGRYLAMNRLVAQRDVKISRVFLLSTEEVDTPSVMAILHAHRSLAATLPEIAKSNMRLRVLALSKDEYEDLIQRGVHRGTWIRREPQVILSVIPTYFDNRIAAVRLQEIRSSPHQVRQVFGTTFDRAIDIDQWIKTRLI